MLSPNEERHFNPWGGAIEVPEPSGQSDQAGGERGIERPKITYFHLFALVLMFGVWLVVATLGWWRSGIRGLMLGVVQGAILGYLCASLFFAVLFVINKLLVRSTTPGESRPDEHPTPTYDHPFDGGAALELAEQEGGDPNQVNRREV
jgi:hypothetical protein